MRVSVASCFRYNLWPWNLLCTYCLSDNLPDCIASSVAGASFGRSRDNRIWLIPNAIYKTAEITSRLQDLFPCEPLFLLNDVLCVIVDGMSCTYICKLQCRHNIFIITSMSAALQATHSLVYVVLGMANIEIIDDILGVPIWQSRLTYHNDVSSRPI